ncbi:hypothetical protein [Bradyrhizobium japonicum]|uniref:hypothetical protein n=1 Tax=Bradyrhizobium japonicum TaxID=375 RepID=UPI001B8A3F1C|nr:hypothetical protein [Bradyrhizobium japonicum]MBR0974326.1 hypothetical protein [Bradyrhizobium japonicum]
MVDLKDDAWFVANKGKQLKSGGSRTGFECLADADSIIKEIHSGFPGANFVEFNVWNAVSASSLAPMFGEIRAISKSGFFILMERLESISDAQKTATPTMPDWLGDFWPNNFGQNKHGEIKIRDYAMVSLGEALENAPRYRRAWQK